MKRVQRGQLRTPRFRWEVLATTLSAGTAPNDIDSDTRGSGGDVTYQQVKTLIVAAANGDDKISMFDIPGAWNGGVFRARGITDGAAVTYQMYAGTLGDGNRHADVTAADCVLAYLGQLAFTIGTQLSDRSGYLMADTLVITSSDWSHLWRQSSPTGNRVAEGRIYLGRADLLVCVPTTVEADCQLLGTGY